jgi:hypothetical protein
MQEQYEAKAKGKRRGSEEVTIKLAIPNNYTLKKSNTKLRLNENTGKSE